MSKSLLWILIGIGSTIGGLIPTWLGKGYLSLWGIVGTVIGAFAGVYFYRQLDI